jgi:hypothetical protein
MSDLNKIFQGNKGFPSPLAPDSEKEKEEYIRNWGYAIMREWFYKNEGQSNSRFGEQKNDFHTRRLFSRGEHPTDFINDLLNEGDDEAYTNFDLRPIQVLPRFVYLMQNHSTERLFKLRAEATDKFSTDQRDQYRKNLENLMASKPLLQDAKELHGVELASEGIDSVPDTPEEVEVLMRMKYKPAIEIATEKALKYTLDINNYEEEDQKTIIRNLIDLGVAGVHHETHPERGILTRAVDPADMIWSFPERKDFKKAYYFGEVQRMTITEAMRISNLSLNKDDLEALATNQHRWSTYMGYSNTRVTREEDLPHMMVDVMFFNFKAYNTIAYKKKHKPGGRFSMIEKDPSFEKPDPSYKGYDAVKKSYDVWYKGAMILGTDILFNYGMCENMVRPNGILDKTTPNYIMYALDTYQGRFKSPVQSCKGYIEQMQQIHTKIQQFIAKARPPGVAVDVHGLQEVVIGKGDAVLTPLELQKIFDQTGNVYYSSVDDDGGINYNREPIRQLPNGLQGGTLVELINSYNHFLELIRSTLGVPQGADATLPDERTLVGVQKMASASSNVATRHILDATLRITQTLGTALGLRLKDIFKYSRLKEAYINAIGSTDVKILEALKKYHLHDLSIVVELKPDQEERESLNRKIELALERDQISIDHALEIEAIDNVKQASEVLKLRREKYAKEKMQIENEKLRVNAEENGKAAERASQAEIQKIMAMEEAKRKTAEVLEQLKRGTLTHEASLKSALMEEEAAYALIVEGEKMGYQSEINLDVEREKTRRDLKKERIKVGAQGPKGSGKGFESSEDNISGSIEMDEIGPS